MKNLLILIVFAAVFLHFYPQPEVTEFYEEQKVNLLAMFSDATDTSVRLRPAKIYEDLEPKFNSFREDEIKHLKAITESRKTVKEFYDTYCQKSVGEPIFHPTNQKLVCSTISKYAGLM